MLPKFLAFAEDLGVDGLVASGHKGNSNQDENKEDLKETITRIKTNVPTPEQLSVSKIKNIEISRPQEGPKILLRFLPRYYHGLILKGLLWKQNNDVMKIKELMGYIT